MVSVPSCPRDACGSVSRSVNVVKKCAINIQRHLRAENKVMLKNMRVERELWLLAMELSRVKHHDGPQIPTRDLALRVRSRLALSAIVPGRHASRVTGRHTFLSSSAVASAMN